MLTSVRILSELLHGEPIWLACRRERQGVKQYGPGRQLVGYQRFGAEGGNRLMIQGSCCNQKSNRDLSTALVRNAHHAGCRDLGMAHQDFFDFTREDIEALVKDDILLAIGDVQEAIVVKNTDVPGINPAVPHHQRRLFPIVSVTGHLMRPANPDLSSFATSEDLRSSCGINDFNIRSRRSEERR